MHFAMKYYFCEKTEGCKSKKYNQISKENKKQNLRPVENREIKVINITMNQ